MSHTQSTPFRRRISRLSWLSIVTLLSLFSIPWTYAQDSAADYLVTHLPGAPEPLLKQYAGHIEITPEHHGNLFFWFFQNRHIAAKSRTVIWFNGGPGCSSMDGALMEVGPYRVNEDGTLRYNNGSWDEYSNLLFIDNPVGTGFSFVDGDSLITELDVMADQVIAFLEKWFAMFPDYAHDDIYIAGESYAGQHIPYIAKAIQDRNSNQPSADAYWNVAGLMIGNGWISGVDQYTSYIPFAYETGIMQSGSAADQAARRQEKECLKALERGGKDRVDVGACERIMMGMNRDLRENEQCYNVYDVRLKDSYPSCGMSWPPDLKQLTPYLRKKDVTAALHISSDKKTGWEECSSQVSNAFNAANSKPSKLLLPDLLEKMPIMLFSGDKDLICNHIGTETLIGNLEWNGNVGMTTNGATAAQKEWTFEGEPAGLWQSARNLTYLRFYNSSHMVPFDFPRRTQDMLHRFMGVEYSDRGSPRPDSSIEGEKDVETPSGSNDNKPSTTPSKAPPEDSSSDSEKEKIDAATWEAYRRSGEAALFVVVIAAIAWGFFVWRGRRKRRGYKGVMASDPYDDRPSGPLDGMGQRFGGRGSRQMDRDIEAASQYDEAELDDLTPKETYALADSDDEGGDVGRRPNGRP